MPRPLYRDVCAGMVYISSQGFIHRSAKGRGQEGEGGTRKGRARRRENLKKDSFTVEIMFSKHCVFLLTCVFVNKIYIIVFHYSIQGPGHS